MMFLLLISCQYKELKLHLVALIDTENATNKKALEVSSAFDFWT